MAIIAWWNDHQFEISPSVIRGFTDLQIKGSGETEDKTGGGEKYVSWKNTKPTELTLTAHLNAYFGCDVRNEAMKFINEARWGKSGYFYAYYNNQWSKLLLYKMMLTDAAVTKVDMAPTGKWVSADVQLTLKSCTVSDDNTSYWGGGSSGGYSSGGSSGGYSKASVKSSSTSTSSSGTSWLKNVANKVKQTAASVKSKVTSANKTIARITSNVKKVTTAKKTTTTARGGGGKMVMRTK